MTNLNDLPFDVTGTTVRTDGGDLHARATSLAEAAATAAAAQPLGDPADTDYGRAQADYQRRLAEMRASSAQSHVEANNARARDAETRKAGRLAAHLARNEQAKTVAMVRKAQQAA